ncbi:hypothetical protein AR158_c758L [Paramecium bursaria Chlorella virus AR158]|uniref:hypothetical protein n=1 Tax=Paramecium bursaria Chlorella virus AR158 TaxID=380598 RepID=UPI00015AA8C3|nr:hypothetical protein AR158_c758L [Paramecium bursaria Chlorella virus AR158]ABU44303.1 hypothetical protein AR158_c758L [Paramecium bursaria Chlorella virus AR158]
MEQIFFEFLLERKSFCLVEENTEFFHNEFLNRTENDQTNVVWYTTVERDAHEFFVRFHIFDGCVIVIGIRNATETMNFIFDLWNILKPTRHHGFSTGANNTGILD